MKCARDEKLATGTPTSDTLHRVRSLVLKSDTTLDNVKLCAGHHQATQQNSVPVDFLVVVDRIMEACVAERYNTGDPVLSDDQLHSVLAGLGLHRGDPCLMWSPSGSDGAEEISQKHNDLV